MHIAICDNSGHAFPIQLSRELARRRHQVLHLHFAEFQSPKGPLSRRQEDPETLEIAPISLGKPFAKYSFVARRSQEIEVGKRTWKRINEFKPDVVLGGNLPLDALRQTLRGCLRADRPFVLWVQDIYSIAIRQVLTKRCGVIGGMLGSYYGHMEASALASSAAIVVIADDFVSVIRNDFGVAADNIHVIENWAPLDEIVPREKTNAWAVEQQLAGREVVLYTGTLGIKHDPALILQLAAALQSRPKTTVIVMSEGPSAEWLAAQVKASNLQNLRMLPYQSFDRYANVLGSADVLIAILEADAGRFSAPSKILSYLCAGRPIVLSAPPENLAFRIVNESQAGMSIPAHDRDGFIAAVRSFLDDPEARASAGRQGRAYAERAFDIKAIGDRFEGILAAAAR